MPSGLDDLLAACERAATRRARSPYHVADWALHLAEDPHTPDDWLEQNGIRLARIVRGTLASGRIVVDLVDRIGPRDPTLAKQLICFIRPEDDNALNEARRSLILELLEKGKKREAVDMLPQITNLCVRMEIYAHIFPRTLPWNHQPLPEEEEAYYRGVAHAHRGEVELALAAQQQVAHIPVLSDFLLRKVVTCLIDPHCCYDRAVALAGRIKDPTLRQHAMSDIRQGELEENDDITAELSRAVLAVPPRA